MTEYALMPIERLQKMIFTIRGIQVMLDSDLAEIYGVGVKRMSEQVKRNIGRFPENFRFQLTQDEFENLRSQIATSSGAPVLRSQNETIKNDGHGGRRYLPFVFTEQGVSMLSAVLRSEKAIQVSIRIINAFVEMRKFLVANASLFERLETVEKRQLSFEIKTDENFEKVFKALESQEEPMQGIFYNGQIFDAYIFAADLIRSAKKSLVLIDNYIDDSVLTLFSKRKKGVKAKLFTKTISKQLKLDLQKHNEQYPGIEVKTFAKAHDRFLIVDKSLADKYKAQKRGLMQKLLTGEWRLKVAG